MILVDRNADFCLRVLAKVQNLFAVLGLCNHIGLGYLESPPRRTCDKQVSAGQNSHWYIIGAILLLTTICFWGVKDCDFLSNWDDDGYVIRNTHIYEISVENIKNLFTSYYKSNYQPVSMLTYLVEFSIFQLQPAPYHITNLLFHLLNTVLVFFLIKKLAGRNDVATITTLFFAIHPMHVESVAWISERKDVVYTTFYLMSMMAYLSYLGNTENRKYYWQTLGLFLLSVLSKSMAVTLPLVLLTWINVVGIKPAARVAVGFAIAKTLPLIAFVVVGLFAVDWGRFPGIEAPPTAALGEASLLLLFAYAGFENTPAAAGEYRNPQRDVPFALLTMIALVTALYMLVQVVALGTLPDLATSTTPLADSATLVLGAWAGLFMTIAAMVSIEGNVGNTILVGPRYLFALARDGFGPRLLAGVHPTYRTPAAAILVQSGIYDAFATKLAARVAVANPSHSVLPGSLTWTWESTRPGRITRSPKS